jgi:hypothetical protein
MNRSDADGVRRDGVVEQSGKSRPGDFLGVFDGVFRTDSLALFFAVGD